MMGTKPGSGGILNSRCNKRRENMPTFGEAFGFFVISKSREAKHPEEDSQRVSEFTNLFLENPHAEYGFVLGILHRLF